MKETTKVKAAKKAATKETPQKKNGKVETERFVPAEVDEPSPRPQKKSEAFRRHAIKRLLNLPSADNSRSLIGHRFLCRGGGGILFSTTGSGKSVFALQLCVRLALGRDMFGLAQPDGKPLRVLYVQAENDEAELALVLRSLEICDELDEDAVATLEENLMIVTEQTLSGKPFIDAISKLIEKHRADLVVADPLLSFMGSDPTRNDDVTEFLRRQINPLLSQHDVGWMWIHHTPKPLNKSAKSVNAATKSAPSVYDVMGGAEIVNWARAVLFLEDTTEANSDARSFDLHVLKRGHCLGWGDARSKSLRHTTESMPDNQTGRKVRMAHWEEA